MQLTAMPWWRWSKRPDPTCQAKLLFCIFGNYLRRLRGAICSISKVCWLIATLTCNFTCIQPDGKSATLSCESASKVGTMQGSSPSHGVHYFISVPAFARMFWPLADWDILFISWVKSLVATISDLMTAFLVNKIHKSGRIQCYLPMWHQTTHRSDRW